MNIEQSMMIANAVLSKHIDAACDAAKAETREFAREVMDRISIKIGFWIRSDAQKRRYEKAKRKVNNHA